VLCSKRSQSNPQNRLGFLQAISRLSFRDCGRVTLRTFYHRGAGLALRAMGRVGERHWLVSGGFWARARSPGRNGSIAGKWKRP